MAKIYKSVDELIGKTPLIELVHMEQINGLNAKIFAKVEKFNPAGSAKDRVGLAMIEEAEEHGLLKEGSVIIEPTSGNTGIGLAMVGVKRGYRVIFTMPDTMSKERIALLKAYGAEIVLTDGVLGMAGSIDKANELHSTIANSFIAGQFENMANPDIHKKTTGPEIWEDIDGKVDFFVAGVGTGGTITGVGEFLKSKNKNIKIVAVEPFNSALLSGEQAGSHDLQGIGANFIPKIMNVQILDEIVKVKDEEAYEMGRMLAKKEGLLVGITSGAATFAAIKIGKRKENEGKNIVVLLPDTGERYLSTKMFQQ